MATQEKTWNVANRLHSLKDSDNPEVNHIIAGADEIYDDTKGAKQSDINAQTETALADRYTKAETYSKEQLDSLITTPDANYVTVATFADLPQTGEANTIYRVSSYDGSQVDASKYALYAWNGATYQLLAVRSAVGEVFDVSEYNSGATYETLSHALAAVPSSVQRGGMSIKFIFRTNTGTEEEPVYNDEYVQYRLMKTTWSNVVSDWQGVESKPVSKSKNLVESNGIFEEDFKQQLNTVIYEEEWDVDTNNTNNGHVFNLNIPAGSYLFSVENVDANNTGNFQFYFTPSSSILIPVSNKLIGIGSVYNLKAPVTKVSIGDINSSISQSGKMKFVIRKLTSNSSVIEELQKMQKDFSPCLYGEFINAHVGSSGFSAYNAHSRAAQVEIQEYNRDITIIAETGYRFSVQTYDSNDNWISDSGWLTTTTIPAGTKYRLLLNKDTNPISATDLMKHYSISTVIGNEIDEEPIEGSINFVKSNGVKKSIDEAVREAALIHKINVAGTGSISSSVCKTLIELLAGAYELVFSALTSTVASNATYQLYVWYEGSSSATQFSSRVSFPVGVKRRIYFEQKVVAMGFAYSQSAAGIMQVSVKALNKTNRELVVAEKTAVYMPHIFCSGNINGVGALNQNTDKAVCRLGNINSYSFDFDIKISVKIGYRYYIQFYDNEGVWQSSRGWYTNEQVIPANTRFGFTIGTTEDSAYDDPDNIENSITLERYIAESKQTYSVVGEGTTGKTVQFAQSSQKLFKITIPQPWDITNVGDGGSNVISVGYRKNNKTTEMQAFNKYELDNLGWTKEFFVKLPQFDIDYWQVFIRANSGVIANFEIEPYTYGDDINTDNTYDGETIKVKSAKFAMANIGRITTFGTPAAQTNAQGMAVYNDRYIIQGCNKVGVGSHILVIDTVACTLNTLTYEELASGQGFHMNTVGLGNKYDAGDTLPLVYCSEFYNAHECKVLRIANDFASFSVVQTISYSGETIQGNYDWIIDIERGLIHIMTINTASGVTGIHLYSFNLPDINSPSIAYTDADIVATHHIPNITGKVILGQGGTIINGKLWTVFGMDRSDYPGHGCVSDLNLDKMVSFFDLTGLGEAEAIAQYQDGVLVCCENGLDSQSDLKNAAYTYIIFNV